MNQPEVTRQTYRGTATHSGLFLKNDELHSSTYFRKVKIHQKYLLCINEYKIRKEQMQIEGILNLPKVGTGVTNDDN